MKLQLTLAWRYLKGRKLRSFLTTLAVVFGVLIIFGMNIILPTMLAAFNANMLAAAGAVDATISHQTGGSFPPEVADGLADIDGVRAITISLNRVVNLPTDFVDDNPAITDRISAVTLIGIDPETARSLRIYQIQEGGRFLEPGDTAVTVISQSLADAYRVGLGDRIALPSVSGVVDLTVVGILPTRTVPGNEEVLVTLPQAQTMTGQEGQITAIDIALDTTDETERAAILAEIESAAGDSYTIGSLQPGSEMFASLQMGQIAMNMFGVLALFMGGFIIFNTFRTVVAERRRDIGMLRAIGANRRTITAIVLIEGLLQGVIGSGIGLVLGYWMGAGIVRLAEAPMNIFLNIRMGNPVVSPTLIATSLLLGVGVTVLAGLIPAQNAARVTPMDALRPTVAEMETRHRMGAGAIAGIVMIAVAIMALLTGETSFIALGSLLFLIGLILVAPLLLHPIAYAFGKLTALLYARQGIGDLAHGNLTRQPSRVVITASATMIGLAIVVALGGMTSSLSDMLNSTVRSSLGSDYLLIPPSISVWSGDMGSGPELTERLQAIDGVGDISTLRFAVTAINGQSISLIGINPETYPRVSGLDFLEGDETAYEALAEGRAMIVNGSFTIALAGLEVGDTVELATPGGDQTYTIVAVGSDLLNAKVVTAYISQANLAADFNRTDDVFIQFNLLPGVELESVDSQIKEVAANYPQFTVLAGRGYIDQMLELVKVLFLGMYFLLAFLALPSLIAMVNTLAISVIERTREIGMLRAVGATRKQVRRMVVAEALLLAAVGTAFGILAGMYLGYVIVKAMGVMFPISYMFPLGGILGGIAIGLIFGALAAIIPARQAARLQVVEALRYE
ncbi:MAG: ABC transporter permease [Anaerolineales bacterium]|nr:ABC transporter permease [Anaerolineales bacterium]